MTRGERVIAVSEAIRDFALAHYPRLEPYRLELIPRGVSVQDYHHGFSPDPAWVERFRNELGLGVDTRLLLMAGRITRLKGHPTLLRLMRALLDDGRLVHALVVGAPDARHAGYLSELHRLAASLRVDRHVSWLGGRSDLREIMSVSDLVLSLSNKPESFGRTVLEALSLGRPVVGEAHGGVGELLAAMYPAGAAPVGDFARLSDTVRRNLDAPQAVRPNERYTLQNMVDSTLDLYQRLLQCPQP